MFAQLKKRIRWAPLQVKFLDKDYVAFLRDLKSFEDFYELRPYQIAMKGLAQLVTGDYESARRSFEIAKETSENMRNPNGDYVAGYCRATLLSFAGQVDASSRVEENLDRIDCHPDLKRLLPNK